MLIIRIYFYFHFYYKLYDSFRERSNVEHLFNTLGRRAGNGGCIEWRAFLYSQEGYVADILKYPECSEITFISHNSRRVAEMFRNCQRFLENHFVWIDHSLPTTHPLTTPNIRLCLAGLDVRWRKGGLAANEKKANFNLISMFAISGTNQSG